MTSTRSRRRDGRSEHHARGRAPLVRARSGGVRSGPSGLPRRDLRHSLRPLWPRTRRRDARGRPRDGTGHRGAAARGASPLVVVEPNAELAAYVATRFGDAVDVRVAAFEEARLEPASFQLATAATSWHWVEQERGLASVAATLVPGGWWATWWTGYHDPEGPDELHHALEPLLEPLPMPPGSGGSGSGFAFEREARLADLDSTAAFGDPHVEELRWSLQLDPQQARALFATFSPILALSAPERERVLSGIERIVADRFAGLAERRCVTILYTARRNAS